MSNVNQPDPKTPSPPEPFPETLWSTVWKAGADDPAKASEALGRLCSMYRQPIYVWLCRTGYDHHAAEDAAQDLMHHLLVKERLPLLHPAMGKFRAWLLTALRNLMNDQYDARVAAKRGGGAEHLSLEPERLAIPADEVDPALDQDLANVLHQRAMEAVDAKWTHRGQRPRVEVLGAFIRDDPAPGEYEAAGAKIGLTAKQVKRAVFDLREDYSESFRAQVADLTNPSDLAAEMRYLLSYRVAPKPSG